MKGDIKLGRILGIDIKLHASWWFIVILLAWVLSSGFFPQFYPNNTTAFYWTAGIASALFLFVSVIIHELAHAMVAKTQNMEVESITLFFFGGVAGITDEDIKPSSEFMMAIAGPLTSFALSAIFFAIFAATSNLFISAITFYLYQLNFILAVFNLIPGYPLDGGRAFRAVLHAYYKDLKKATLIASYVGKGFAFVLIILGIIQIISGFLGGLWLILIGFFLNFIAGVSYQQVVFKQVLSQWTIKKLISKDYKTIQSNQKLSTFLNKNLGSRDTAFVVKAKQKVVGITEVHKIDAIKQAVTKQMTVGQVTQPLSQIKTLNQNDNAYQAFQELIKSDSTFLPVTDKKQSKSRSNKAAKVTGIIRKDNIMNALVWNLKFKANFEGKAAKAKSIKSKKSTKKTNKSATKKASTKKNSSKKSVSKKPKKKVRKKK